MLAWIWPWISAIPETRAVQCCIPLQVHTLSTNIISLKVPSIPIFVLTQLITAAFYWLLWVEFCTCNQPIIIIDYYYYYDHHSSTA